MAYSGGAWTSARPRARSPTAAPGIPAAEDVLEVSGGTFTGNPPTLRQGSLALTGGTGVARIHMASSRWGRTWRRAGRSGSGSRQRRDAPADLGRRHTDQRGTIVFAADPVPGANERVTHGDRHPRRGDPGQHRHDPHRRRRLRRASINAEYATGQNYNDPNAFKQNGTLDVRQGLSAPPFTQRGGTTAAASPACGYGRLPAAGHGPGSGARGRHDDRQRHCRGAARDQRGGVVARTPGAPLAEDLRHQLRGDRPREGTTSREPLDAAHAAEGLGHGLLVGGNASWAAPGTSRPRSATRRRPGRPTRSSGRRILGSSRTGTFKTDDGRLPPTYGSTAPKRRGRRPRRSGRRRRLREGEASRSP